jgi:crotonobetainyl-CoA:carnitine CoA-transferase CaiB-like acyl-CoA transferase
VRNLNQETGAALFAGLKVIDCASYIAAPCAATVLGDYGADVIKIEPPEGDAYRNIAKLPGSANATGNYPWELDSRNKRSLCLDLKIPAGLAVLQRLLLQTDVFVTNLPLQVRARLQIGQEALCALNPRLVYASFTAYGEIGPEADKPGFDATAWWARSGMMDMIRPDSESPPARSVAGMGDHPSGIALYAAIVSALYQRERSGKGGVVSSSLLANGLWANGSQVQASLMGGGFPPRLPRSKAPNPFSNSYRCKDGRWLNLVIINEARQCAPLFKVLGCADQLLDAKFLSEEARRANPVELIALFDSHFAQRDLADWRSRLDAVGISFGVVTTLADIPSDEQMRASGALVPFADGVGLTVATPFGIAGHAQVAPRRAPEKIGQDNEEVLLQAGFTQDEITGLRRAGVLGAQAVV